jgi:hypothetical protein
MEEMKAEQAKAEADRKADQAKAEADRKIDKEERKAAQAKADADRVQTQELMKMMQAYQAKTDAVLPAIQVTETSRKETAAVIKPETEVKTMACQEMEAHQKEEEPTSADRKPEAAEQREAPIDGATVIPVGEPKKKRRRDRKLAAEHRPPKPKTSIRENRGPQKRLAVACSGSSRHGKVTRHTKETDRKMTCRAKVARCRGHIIGNNQTRNNIARGAPRGQRLQVKMEGGIGVKNEYTRQHLHPGNVRTASRTLRKTQGLDAGQQAVETFSRLQGIKNSTLRSVKGLGIAKQTNTSPVQLQRRKHWTLWRGRPPPKRKKGNGSYGRNQW